MLRALKNLDWILIVSAVLLVCFGLLSIYSSSLGKGDFLKTAYFRRTWFSAFIFVLFFGLSDLKN